MMSAKRKAPVVPPSPYSFEETVRRVLQAPPMPKRKVQKEHKKPRRKKN